MNKSLIKLNTAVTVTLTFPQGIQFQIYGLRFDTKCLNWFIPMRQMKAKHLQSCDKLVRAGTAVQPTVTGTD